MVWCGTIHRSPPRYAMHECCSDLCGWSHRYMVHFQLYIVCEFFNMGIGLMNCTFEVSSQEKITLSNVMRMKLLNHDLWPFTIVLGLDQMFSSMHSCRIQLCMFILFFMHQLPEQPLQYLPNMCIRIIFLVYNTAPVVLLTLQGSKHQPLHHGVEDRMYSVNCWHCNVCYFVFMKKFLWGMSFRVKFCILKWLKIPVTEMEGWLLGHVAFKMAQLWYGKAVFSITLQLRFQ
jgi:hypothetical protein